jgi:DNA polymerase-1
MLIDGNAFIHRGYHAVPFLTTKSGEQTNAVFGFTTIVLKAIKELKPTHIACTFDLAGPTFRHKQYEGYKATRVKADQALYDQIPRVKQVVRALNIPIFEKSGYEADDCLGTLASVLHQTYPNAEIIIATGDLDTLQLVNHVIKVYTLRKGIADTAIYDAKAVRQRYGLSPEQLIDYRGLRGDASDNIPGVKGIGEKGASDLIRQFGSIENLYKEIREKRIGNRIKPRILNLLLEQEKEARMSYELSVIDKNVPIDISVPKYEFTEKHKQAVFKLFQELEFRSLLSKLPSQSISESSFAEATEDKSANPPSLKLPRTSQSISELATGGTLTEALSPRERQENIGKQDYQLVDTEAKLVAMLKALSTAPEICVDTETTSLDITEAELVGIGLCAKTGQAYYVPASLALASEELKSILANEKIAKIGHNIKYDLQVLNANRYPLRAIFFDTMIASYLLNAGTRQHGLDAIVFSELGYQMQSIEELIGKGKEQITMDKVPVEKVAWYCSEDVDMTLRLKEIFLPKLQAEGLEKIFNEIELPLVKVLAEMESVGIKLNAEFLNQLSAEAEIDIRELEKDIYKLSGEEFNLNSPKQMKEVLFEKMKLEPIANKKNKSGLSTAAGELEKMLGQHPVIEKIMQYRELAKLQNTYLLTLPQLVSKKTGRLHTSYNQTIAATGRLSSVDPNLQNIPVKGEGLGSKIRQAFVAEKGFKLLSLDYSQIELRIAAHLSRDEKMLQVFQNNEDIHTKTAMAIFGVSSEQVTKDMRRDAKTINFGILYGVSSFGLSARIGEMSNFEAKQFIEKYFLAFPKVEEYIEQIKLQVREEGFVRNELGRIRKFPEIKSSQFFVRAAAERAAVNFPIQSLAADVIKVAMINIHRELESKRNRELENPEIRMLLQVHDELVFEVREDKVDDYIKLLIPLMENAIKLTVPIKVEAKVGKNWGELYPVKS